MQLSRRFAIYRTDDSNPTAKFQIYDFLEGRWHYENGCNETEKYETLDQAQEACAKLNEVRYGDHLQDVSVDGPVHVLEAGVHIRNRRERYRERLHVPRL